MTLCTVSKQADMYKLVYVTVSPIHRTEIHSQHHALLRVLTTIGWDHHHVASDLMVGALQTNRLTQGKTQLMPWQLIDNLRTEFVCVF